MLRRYAGPPYRVVVLHGGPGAPGCAAGLCRGLAEHFGVTEHLQKADSLQELMEEIRQIIFLEKDRQVALVGHSFGAWLALLFAERYPALVSRVVLVGCGPLESSYVEQLALTRHQRQARGRDTDNYCALPGSSQDMLFFDRRQHVALMEQISALRQSGELRERARRVNCPILALHGEYDPHPAQGVTEPLAGKENFRIRILPRCGHDPWKEKYAREEFFRLLLQELKTQ